MNKFEFKVKDSGKVTLFSDPIYNLSIFTGQLAEGTQVYEVPKADLMQLKEHLENYDISINFTYLCYPIGNSPIDKYHLEKQYEGNQYS